MTQTGRWTMDRLRVMSREDLEELFRTLDPPPLDELAGEYLPGCGDFIWDDFQALCRDSGWGTWEGKGFAPHPHRRWPGQGYNLWRGPDGVVVRNQRFATEIGPSIVDGRPSLIMWYTAFRHPLADLDLIDEVRKLGEGIYLCMGAPGRPVPRMAPRVGRDGRAAPESFFLSGPVAPWTGPDDEDAELVH